MREAKEAIKRQLAELQTLINRTAQKVAQQDAEEPSAVQHELG